MVSTWIQRADFSTTERDVSSTREAVRAYEQHDWAAESELERELDSAGRDHCPPGIGFVMEDGHILHVCPREDEVSINYHHLQESKLLGFIPISKPQVVFVEAFPSRDVGDLIERFVRGDYAETLAQLEAAQPS